MTEGSEGSEQGILVAAGGEGWEAQALGVLAASGLRVLRRCVDLTDVLATARTTHADLVVAASSLQGLDHDAVTQLLRHDVRILTVGPEDLSRLGVVAQVAASEVADLAERIERVRSTSVETDPVIAAAETTAGSDAGRVVAVLGPNGAPGRTTVAMALAALRARSGPTVLIDADPYGGAVAQYLGILDEVSGLLAAARLVNSGSLDSDSFARCRRRVADGLEVLTGLPRADRWIEVRAGVVDAVLTEAAAVGDVVVDSGFCLEDDSDLGRSSGRHQLTLDALAAADEVVVVGTAEPVGLARLARLLGEAGDQTAAPLHVVVNRMRAGLGWREPDLVGLIEGYARPASVHFLPEDRAGLDKALVAGRCLTEVGDSALRRALVRLSERVLPLRAQELNSR